MFDASSRLPTLVARPRAAPDTSWVASIPDAFRRPEQHRRAPSPVGLLSEARIEPPLLAPTMAVWTAEAPRPTDAAWRSE